MNKLLTLLDNSLLRPFLVFFITLNYYRKGKRNVKVKYIKEYHKWMYNIDGLAFLSTGPGWAYSYEFLLQELKNISCYYYLPKEGDVVIDLGAGIGEETIVCSKLIGDTGKVYSIEAHPPTFHALDYIVKQNSLKNVSCYNIAISSEAGITKIEDNSDTYIGNSINAKRGSSKYFEVNTLTLSDFISNNKILKVNFLKVNIEGAEQLMIKGMDEVIDKIEHAAVSCHDFRYERGEDAFFKTRELVTQYFISRGFSLQKRSSGNIVWDNYMYFSK